jgi:dipeptidyl aminopeptidase/acylaminoacyl peptidase
MNIRRILLIIVILILVLLLVGYVGASTMIYNQLSATEAGCATESDRDNTPAAFDDDDVDTTPYLMSDFQEVSFSSRGDGITLQAWYVPAEDEAAASTVVLVHGLTSCRRSPSVLLPAGMLHRAGYNVLLPDLRDHGDSQIEDGRYAGGSEEWRDALGAWDWLVNERGIPPENIGLFGVSLGAVTVMVATGEEPRVAAVWEDSGFGSITDAVNAELTRNGFPTFLSSGALLMGRLIAGDDIGAYSPLTAMGRLEGRPIFITHGTADTRLSVDFAQDLAEAVRADGGTVEPWIIEGATHVEGMFIETEEYERRLLAFFDVALGG